MTSPDQFTHKVKVVSSSGAFGDALHVAITNGNSIWDEFSSSEGTLATGWHHIALTVSISSGTMVMYLDGEVVGSMETMTNSISGLGETTQNWLGRSQYEDPYFNGSLDDFRIYNHVLSIPNGWPVGLTELWNSMDEKAANMV